MGARLGFRRRATRHRPGLRYGPVGHPRDAPLAASRQVVREPRSVMPMRRFIAALLGGLAAALLAERWLAARERTGRPFRTAIESRVAVLTDRRDVWAVLGDLEGQVRWMHDAKAIRVLTPGPVGLGTRAEADVRIFGLATTDVVEITAWEPPVGLAIRHLGTFRGEGEVRLEEAGPERTVVVWRERLAAPVFPHLAALALRPVLRRVFQADLERLAALALEEAGGTNDGGQAGREAS